MITERERVAKILVNIGPEEFLRATFASALAGIAANPNFEWSGCPKSCVNFALDCVVEILEIGDK